MRFSDWITLVISALTLGACATYAEPAELSAGKGDALLVAERNDFGSLQLVLEGVDMTAQRFTGERIELSSIGDTLKGARARQSFNRDYLAKRIPAGSYASVGTIDSTFGGTSRRPATVRRFNCYSQGASTFAIEAGRTYFIKTEQGRLANSAAGDIAAAQAALSRAGVNAAPVEPITPQSLITFNAGRDVIDKLTASASCPAGKGFKTVAEGIDVDRLALSAIWRPADCKQLDCAGPKLGDNAVQALKPALIAYRDEHYQEALQLIDSAFTREVFATKREFYAAMYLRVLTVAKLDSGDIALIDGDRILGSGVIPEENLVNLRLQMGAIHAKKGDFAEANDQLREAVKNGDIKDARFLSVAVHAAAKAGRVDDALAYVQHIEAKLGPSSAFIYYALAYSAFNADGRRDAADRIVERFSAARGIPIETARENLSKTAGAAQPALKAKS